MPTSPELESGPTMWRKKPVVVEAWQMTDQAVAPAWISAAIQNRQIVVSDTEVLIPTLEGEMRVSEGDWIIKGVKGEFYPCRPDIFAATYEPAGSAPSVAAAAGEMMRELQKLYRAYVGTLDLGRDRIIALGGSCDPVDVMEEGDPALRSARAALTAAHRAGIRTQEK